MQALRLQKHGGGAKAIAILSQVIEGGQGQGCAPLVHYSYLTRGKLHLQLGCTADAERDLLKATQICPSHVGGWSALLSMLEQRGALQKALVLCKHVMASQPT